MSAPARVEGPAQCFSNDATHRLITLRAASRLGAGDPTLWGSEAEPEARERLGWVTAAEQLPEVLERAHALRRELASLPYERVLLCGMGGSSLAPQVMSAHSPIPLVALDSIHPDRVERLCGPEDLLRSVIVISSKSGGTSETRTQLSLCEARLRAAGEDPAQRIIVITDPDSELEEHARLRGYRTVLGDPRVGGRYSALTVFGVVPAVLAGIKSVPGHEQLAPIVHACAQDTVTNPAFQLASALYQAHERSGVAQFISHAHTGFAPWIEQLIAESTGKQGQGLLPVVRDSTPPTSSGGTVFTLFTDSGAVVDPSEHPSNGVSVAAPLAVQFYLWEVATALLCALTRVNPFDQPDVERTKRAARNMRPGQVFPPVRHEYSQGFDLMRHPDDAPPHTLTELGRSLHELAATHSFVVVQAFLPTPSPVLEHIAVVLEAASGTPATVSYGPEYLHSTGQLHKGGMPGGLFVHVYQEATTDIQVPETITSFAWLCAAASFADQLVLSDLGRTVVGVRIQTPQVLNQLVEHL